MKAVETVNTGIINVITKDLKAGQWVVIPNRFISRKRHVI